MREVCDPEQEKFKMFGVYVTVAQTIMNWQYLEKEELYKDYVEEVSHMYSIFNHPLPEYFQ